MNIIALRSPPVSLQKHVLQSFFHDMPGMHLSSAGLCLLCLKFWFCPKHSIIVQAAIPFSNNRKFSFSFCGHLETSFTCAETIVASVIPRLAGLTVEEWRLNCSLSKLFRWARSSCAEPANSICSATASIAILQSWKSALELIENWMRMSGTNLHFNVIWSADMIVAFVVLQTSLGRCALRRQSLGFDIGYACQLAANRRFAIAATCARVATDFVSFIRGTAEIGSIAPTLMDIKNMCE